MRVSIVLDGTNSCVQLPNDLFTNYDSISFEVWFADKGINSQNAQLYSFTGINGGMNYSLFGQGDFFLRGMGLFAIRSNLVTLVTPSVGETNHLIFTEDGTSNVACIYANGILAAQNSGFTNTPATIGSTTTNLIGAGVTNNPASNFKGSILEFRTYQGALSPLDAAVLDAFGPDQPQTDPGTLQAVRLVLPSQIGPGALFRAGVFADFSAITNVNIGTQPDLVLTSDNTNVITIAPDQRLQTISLGAANITASWQGFSNTASAMVVMPQDIALVHRYSFNEQTNDWIVHDSVGAAHGRLFNPIVSSHTTGVFSGNGEMILAGSSGGLSPHPSGYAALPVGIISSLSEVSIEVWITWTPGSNSQYAWQRIFDFGSYVAGGSANIGNNYLFLTSSGSLSNPIEPLHFAVTTNYNNAETPTLEWTNPLPLNVTSFVAVTYSPARGVAKLYLNGALVASGVPTIPLSGIFDTNNWLGRSQFSPDPYLGGRYNEFRIYSGLLSDSDVAADYAAGPDTVGVDYVLHDFLSGNALTITWGPSATNLVLKSSPALGAGAVWNPVPAMPILQNGRYDVTVPVSNNAAFFRLQAP